MHVDVKKDVQKSKSSSKSKTSTKERKSKSGENAVKSMTNREAWRPKPINDAWFSTEGAMEGKQHHVRLFQIMVVIMLCQCSHRFRSGGGRVSIITKHVLKVLLGEL